SNLLVRLRRDDGAIVYLNEVEIFRSNMPFGSVNALTPASTTTPEDGEKFFSALVSPSLINIGDNQIAVEIHQAAVSSSDISFELEFLGNVDTAGFQPPAVSLLAPEPGDTVAANVTFVANATDVDGTIAGVDFFDGGNWVGSSTVPQNLYYTLSWSNAPSGTHVLTAVAFDSTGLNSTSAPVSITVLPAIIPRGAEWKYLDDGSNPGIAWRNVAFDDHTWSNGVAQLGYGDGDETTTTGFGPEPANRYITTYFRHAFAIANPSASSNLVVRVLRDDGAIVYLNGTEVFRNNMPGGAVSFTTPAVSAIDDDKFHGAPVMPALLVAGQNTLAVEIHQASGTSSDISFDLELLSNLPPTPPRVRLLAPTNGTIWFGPTNLMLVADNSDVDSPVATVAFFDGALDLGATNVDITGGATLIRSFNPGSHTLRAVATDTMGLSATSAPINITVIPAPILTTLVATGSVWRYFDTNYAPAAGWRTAGFDDSTWKSGPGILGYGVLGASSLPATQINSGPNPNNRQITSYFRRLFTATNAGNVTNLSFGVVRDDGAVVYLNGNEIFRMNMQTGAVSYATFAITTNAVSGTNEYYYFPTNLVPAPGMLLEGTNVLAVELHQNAVNTSDAAFDLGLFTLAPPGGRPTLHATFDGARVHLSWNAPGFTLLESASPLGPFSPSTNSTSPAVFTPALPARFYQLRQP
ncbi:MAG: trimeric autotransporter adhesin, partial [Verrucomicrobiota bacterium]